MFSSLQEQYSRPPMIPRAEQIDIRKFFAGWFGGICVTAACQPFDAIKVHSQVQHMTPLKSALNLWQQEGPMGFYRGVCSPFVGVGLAYSVKFGVYGNLTAHYTQRRLEEEVNSIIAAKREDHRRRTEEADRRLSGIAKTWRQIVAVIAPSAYADVTPGIDPSDMSTAMSNAGRLPFHINVGCAAAGGIAEALVMTPFEVVRLRLLTQSIYDHREYHGGLDCARTLWSEGGIRKLYLGLGATVLRDVPASILFFGTYGTLRGVFFSSANCSLKDLPASLVAGGIAGAVTWSVVLPLDTLKTHMQTAPRKPHEGLLHFASLVYREGGGIRGFYVSWTPALFRASFANAILVASVETCFRFARLLDHGTKPPKRPQDQTG